MQKLLKNKSNLLGGSLMVRESRIVAQLLLNQANSAEWEQAIVQDNILQKNTIATAKRVVSTLRKRLDNTLPEFLDLLVNGDDELARQVAFYSVLQSNQLLVAFMKQVVADAYLLHHNQLARSAWSDFASEQENKDPEFKALKDSSKDKIREVIYRILVAVGYLQDSKSLILKKVLIRPELIQLLETHDQLRLLACLQVSLLAR